MRGSTDKLIIFVSVAIDLHDISIPSGSIPRRPKTTTGSYSKHQPLTLAQQPQRRRKQKCSRSVGALRERKPFLKTLFIFRFFILAQQAAIFQAQTEGCLAHLVRSGRQRGNEGWREVTVLRAGQERPA